jgi:hypothetical protein
MRDAVATNWDEYYDATVPTAHLTRAYTLGWLKRQILQQSRALGRPVEIIEFGGGNSCFAEGLLKGVPISRYHVVDLNQKSLRLFSERLAGKTDAQLSVTRTDLLTATPDIPPADVVFSVGLIEHFDVAGTATVAGRHFEVVRPGGLVVVTAPTPTLLYRGVRGLAELTGQWKFPDERPLKWPELRKIGEGRGSLVKAEILWPLMLTQYAAAWRAEASG